MKYSIIIPVYNVEKYLDKCMDSLVNQRFSDYEIILVDDASTDNSGVMADGYATRYPDIVRVIHQENKGCGGARNTGIESARGEYLILVDSDDWVSDDFLEVIDYNISKKDTDILIFNAFYVTESGKILCKLFNDNIKKKELTSAQFVIEEPGVWNKVYRKSIFMDHGIRYPEKTYYQDLATTPMMAIHAKNIVKIDAPLYYYLQRNDSAMRDPKISKILMIRNCINRVLNYYQKNGKFEEYKNELEWLMIRHVLYASAMRILLFKYDKEALDTLQQYVVEKFPNYKNNMYISHFEGLDSFKGLRDVLNGHYKLAQAKALGFIRFKKRVKRVLVKLKVMKE